MRRDGIFIAVEVDDSAAADPQLAAKLAEACPVDIFAQQSDGSLEMNTGPSSARSGIRPCEPFTSDASSGITSMR